MSENHREKSEKSAEKSGALLVYRNQIITHNVGDMSGPSDG